MKPLNLITLLLVIIGGINWGLIGLANFNLVTALFGVGAISTLIYLLVGASAFYQLLPFSQAISEGEVRAEAGVDRVTRL